MASGERFHKAIRENDQITVQDLLSKGVDINSVYYGMSPLFVAITKGYPDMASLLLANGCLANVKDVKGVTALEEAVTRDHTKVVRQLLSSGEVNIDLPLRNGHTALTYAALKRLILMTQILREGGADVNLTNSRDETPLFVASTEGCLGVINELLKSDKLDKSQLCGREKMTPLIAATANSHIGVVKLLLKSGCNINQTDTGSWTALWHAVTDSNDALVRILLQAGADSSIPDSEGKQLIHVAMENEDDKIIELLQKAIT